MSKRTKDPAGVNRRVKFQKPSHFSLAFTPAEISSYYKKRVPELKQADGREWRGPCPIHQGERDSFAVNPENGAWFCHSECSRGGSILKLEMELNGVDFKSARAEVDRIIGRDWRTVATYVYTDRAGQPLFRVVRRERREGAGREKSFHLERYENGHWRKGLGKVRRVPYRLHKVVNAKGVFIVEGEKDADTLRKQLQVIATTNPMGAGKWLQEYNKYFKGKNVTIIPDNDSAGRTHALQIAESLLPIAASVRMLELPALPAKGDASDWVRAGGTREKLVQLRTATPILDKARLAELRKRWGVDSSQLSSRFPFSVTEEAVIWRTDAGELVKLSACVDVIAETRDAAGHNWGRLLRWKDNESRLHTWAMPMELLASDAGAVRVRLLAEGLPYITTNARYRERLAEYLQTAPADRRIRCVERVGWHDNTYVLPDEALAPEGSEEVLYQKPHEAAHYWNVSGTAEEWSQHVGQLCAGNSRLVFAASSGFAGPLLDPVGEESGGFHYYGGSSIGKTAALMAGSSVCGGGGKDGFLQSWRTTMNGLEAVAEAHNDGTLFLDELSQSDAREAGETVYMLGNGQGKIRMTRSIATRRKLIWNLLYFSSGEMTLAEHAASAGKRTRGGVAVRLLNIEADAGKGLGLFENLHGTARPDEFARKLKAVARRYYGAPFRAFVARLTLNRRTATEFIRETRTAFANRFVPENGSGEVRRAAERFGLICAAGELATRWGLTGWREDEAFDAAGRCFNSWLGSRGTSGPSDMEAAVRQIRGLLQAGGISRFPMIGALDKAPLIREQAGFRRRNSKTGETVYLVFTEIFRTEFCKGYSYQAVAKELGERKYLVRADDRMTIKARLPGFKETQWVYCLREAILRSEE